MPYALIPEGFELKKVTKLQEEAVKAHRRHEDIVALLGNEKVPALIAGGVLLASAPTILKLIFDALKKQDNGFDLGEAAIDYGIFVKDFAEGFFELTGSGVFAGDPFEGEAKDFWDKYVKR
mgnify:CR=1 FL=1